MSCTSRLPMGPIALLAVITAAACAGIPDPDNALKQAPAPSDVVASADRSDGVLLSWRLPEGAVPRAYDIIRDGDANDVRRLDCPSEGPLVECLVEETDRGALSTLEVRASQPQEAAPGTIQIDWRLDAEAGGVTIPAGLAVTPRPAEAD